MRRSRLGPESRVRLRTVRACLAALALITLGVACATSSKGDDIEYVTLACEPGSVRECKCADDKGRGFQICTSDGTTFGECEECTGAGTCTTYPNCKGCFDCFETCRCQSGARFEAQCRTTCS